MQLHFRDDAYFSSLTTYKNDELVKVLTQLGLTYPQINHQLLGAYLQGLGQQRLIPRVRRNTMS